MMPTDPIALSAPQPLPVPASYAEKAMASLMQLHSELMDEKERRVELYRTLMEKEQALAELKLYVKMLEERAAQAVPPVQTVRVAEPVSTPHQTRVVDSMPPPQQHHHVRRPDGWKVW